MKTITLTTFSVSYTHLDVYKRQNLDKLEVTNDSAAEPGVEVNLLDNGGFERPTWESSNWTEWHPDGQTQAYGVDKGIGMNPPETAKEGEQSCLLYTS